ncbi:tRNA lysidine(34) synthetase TilS [Vallitalea sp.]|uniref:tRNA lysidine(34) synthetase TilS n=1 Tax=Vallitalea sp. TaxID=1882829 RepID=UPI0025DE4D30|nr:tRNA lysidine(34) synthetase TilS [Vallitalea sp.]MCT4688071.1 tRNA lysidine(34) synthetase TilS [Vallitalea sp.]
MVDKVLNTIQKFNMIDKGDNIIIGVSGGADSICLLHMLCSLKSKLDIDLHVVHVQHGIRGKDADEDAKFVEKFCDERGIVCHVYYFNVKKLAKEKKMSEEEMGRKVRYQVFSDASKELGGTKIALAHHINDNAETVIMNLLRGTGIKGIGGIRPKRDNIIRPLIECTREEIEKYCVDNNIEYRDDYTNQMEIYTRNKIRHTVIPYIENNFNQNFIANLVNTANLVRSEDDYIDKIVLREKEKIVKIKNKEYSIDTNKFLQLDTVIKRRLIRNIIGEISSLKDIEYKHINEIIQLADKQVSKRINLPKGLIAKKTYDSIIITNLGENKINDFEYQAENLSRIYIKELNKHLDFRIIEEKKYNIPKNLYTKWFDYDKIKDNLKVRSRKSGDLIAIKGINGTKKLKKYFIDCKIPKEQRDAIPLLTDGNNIIWVIGYRISEVYKVTASTKKILEVRYY